MGGRSPRGAAGSGSDVSRSCQPGAAAPTKWTAPEFSGERIRCPAPRAWRRPAWEAPEAGFQGRMRGGSAGRAEKGKEIPCLHTVDHGVAPGTLSQQTQGHKTIPPFSGGRSPQGMLRSRKGMAVTGAEGSGQRRLRQSQCWPGGGPASGLRLTARSRSHLLVHESPAGLGHISGLHGPGPIPASPVLCRHAGAEWGWGGFALAIPAGVSPGAQLP